MIQNFQIDTKDVQLFAEPVFIAGFGKRPEYKYCILVKDGTPSAENVESNLRSYLEAVQQAQSTLTLPDLS